MPKGKSKSLHLVDTILMIAMSVILSLTVLTMLWIDIINGG